jgi:uncharacterized protein (DUF1778 family)
MSKKPTARTSRLTLRVRSVDKAIISKAAALSQMDMTSFVLRSVLRKAKSVIDKHERVRLTERDSLLVMHLLENPPPPNARLLAAARALARRS